MHNQQTPRAEISFRIDKLLVIQTGSYNPLYLRPYQSNFNASNSDALFTRLASNGGNGVSGASLSGIASDIISPSTQHEGVAGIPNGWDIQRGRFVLNVEVNRPGVSRFIYKVQGFTSHFALASNGTPDPSIMFYINSISKIARSIITTPSGLQEQDVVTSTYQVINGRVVSSNVSGASDVFSCRPVDLLNVMQFNVIASGSNYANYDQVHDTRQSFNGQSILNGRKNNLPGNMLASLINAHGTATAQGTFGAHSTEIFTQSKGFLDEGIIAENEFMRAISSISGRPETTYFNMSELSRLDPNVYHDDVSKFLILNSAAMRKVHTAGQSEYWHKAGDKVTMVASALCSQVPAIMMDLMIGKIGFKATNHDSGGNNNIVIEVSKDIGGRDMSYVLEAFKLKFVREVMYGLTHQNSELYSLSMLSDLYGDTTVTLSYGNSPYITYVMPSFCDSLVSPVVTRNHQNLLSTASDMNEVLTQAASASRAIAHAH